jgi:hypothetical protein
MPWSVAPEHKETMKKQRRYDGLKGPLTGSSQVFHSDGGTLPGMKTRLAVALVCALGLTACGGDPTTPAASGDNTGDSPLAEYMGAEFASGRPQVRMISGQGEGQSEEDLAKQRKVEDLIASCMRDQGFRYVPVPPRADDKSTFDEAFKLPPDKFAEQYGYGISTLDFKDPGADDDNPNTAIRNALSAQAKKAYDKALDGDGGGLVIAVPGKATSGKQGPQGCRGKAIEQVFGKPKGDPGQEMRRFDGLFKDLEALRKRIEADQRVVDAAKAWSDCMADARYTGLSKPEDARQKVQQRWERLLGIQSQPGPGGGVTSVSPKKPKDVDPAQLAALKKYELAIAKADYTCAKDHYDPAYKQVRNELEREFVDTHKTVLEQYKEWAAQQKGQK